VAHFFVVVGGSKIHERPAHFFIDIYNITLEAWTQKLIFLLIHLFLLLPFLL